MWLELLNAEEGRTQRREEFSPFDTLMSSTLPPFLLSSALRNSAVPSSAQPPM
jgi:hypothetical protein